MYTSGFSARVANPRRTLVVILAEDAANFEKASIVGTNNGKGEVVSFVNLDTEWMSAHPVGTAYRLLESV